MKLTQLFTALFLLITTLSYSQYSNIQTMLSERAITTTFDLTDKTIQGTPYIIDDFTPARVSADNDKIFHLRYNAVNDEMEVQIEKNAIQAINNSIEGVTITFLVSEKTYKSVNYTNADGVTKRGYFIFVNSPKSKFNLLLKESKKFIKSRPAETSYDIDKPAEFKRLDDQYFISSGDTPAVEFPKKKKEFPKIFPNKHKDILSFIRKNKIKTSKEEDLVELINYINTL